MLCCRCMIALLRFAYWRQHLILFSTTTLEMLARQASVKVIPTHHYQRYPLSNHLYWLSDGQPGGHQRWIFLDTLTMSYVYANALTAAGKTETLIAYLESEC
jgi:hypothetical protein